MIDLKSACQQGNLSKNRKAPIAKTAVGALIFIRHALQVITGARNIMIHIFLESVNWSRQQNVYHQLGLLFDVTRAIIVINVIT